MDGNNKIIITLLWVVAIVFLLAAQLWVVGAAVVLILLGALIYNAEFGTRIEKMETNQREFIDAVDYRLDAVVEHIGQMREDLNKGFLTFQEKAKEAASSVESAPDEIKHVDLVKKILDIENRLHRLDEIVEREEEPSDQV